MLELLDKARRLTKVGLKVKEVNETIENMIEKSYLLDCPECE